MSIEGVYSTTNGSYTGSDSTISSSYLGEWIKIELPVSIIVSKMIITSKIGTSFLSTMSPKSFRIYGSTNNSTWTNIYSQSNATYVDGIFAFNISTSTSFRYYAIVINGTTSTNNTYVAFTIWEIFEIFEKATQVSVTDNSYFLNYSNSGGWNIGNLAQNTLIQSLSDRITALGG
jgi:hypothetical protein